MVHCNIDDLWIGSLMTLMLIGVAICADFAIAERNIHRPAENRQFRKERPRSQTGPCSNRCHLNFESQITFTSLFFQCFHVSTHPVREATIEQCDNKCEINASLSPSCD